MINWKIKKIFYLFLLIQIWLFYFSYNSFSKNSNLNNVLISNEVNVEIEKQKENNIYLEEEKKEKKLDEERGLFYLKTNKYLESIKKELSEEIVLAIFDKSKKKNIDPYIILAQIKKESTFNKDAYNKGCIWLLQISKYPLIWYNQKYWTNYKFEQLYSEKMNLEIWIDYLFEKINENNWNIHYSLMAYNWWNWYLKRMLNSWIYSTKYSRDILQLSKEIKEIVIN